jgi:hypothetical protein
MAMRATTREWVDVIQCRRVEIEGCAAVDTASAAVAHGSALDGALVSGSAEEGDAGALTLRGTGEAGKHDAVTVSTNRHFTSRKKATPRDGKKSRDEVS